MAKNKLQKFAEMASYQHVFEASYEDVHDKDFHLKGHWNNEFFNNQNPIVLELGCGRGEYTVGLARLFPNVNFIGVDIKGARMHTGATQAINEGLTNVAFLRTHIEFLESFFAPDEVSEIWVTFPDPQMHKPRKRLVGTVMLARYSRFLQSGGFVHLKTDSPFLSTYMTAMLEKNRIDPEVATLDLYHTELPDAVKPILSIQTYYESKWLEHGLTIKYFKFKVPENQKLEEPEIDIEFDNYHMVGRNVAVRN